MPVATSLDMSELRFGIYGAIGTLFGVLLSGPLAVIVVEAIHPQPPWQGAAVFAQSYHPAQLLPYLGGVVLVAALALLVSSLHALAEPNHRALTGTALVLCGAFVALILFNYGVQSAFVPELARRYEDASAPILATFSMSNPTSLAWAIEMWGWGLFGVATWLLAPVFNRSRLERATGLVFTANGVVSLVGVMVTVARPGWVMTPSGLFAFASWNVLLAAMAALSWITLRRREASTQGA